MSSKSQCAYILRYMQNGYSISPLEALKMFGCFRLGARIYDLKQNGKRIRSTWVTDANGKRFKEYWMPVSRGVH